MPASPTAYPHYRVSIDGRRPFALTRRDALDLLPSPKLLARMLHTVRDADPARRWLELARQGAPGREVLITTESFERACERLRKQEQPPLLPSEVKRVGGERRT